MQLQLSENMGRKLPTRKPLPLLVAGSGTPGKDGDNFLHNVHCICGNCYQAIMYGCSDINEEDKEFEETLIYDSWPKKEKNNC